MEQPRGPRLPGAPGPGGPPGCGPGGPGGGMPGGCGPPGVQNRRMNAIKQNHPKDMMGQKMGESADTCSTEPLGPEFSDSLIMYTLVKIFHIHRSSDSE